MPAALDPSLPSSQPPRPAPSLAKARLRSVDLLIGALVLGSVSLVGAATVAARLEAGRTGPPDAAIAEAVETLRRSFGYDGIVHELERLRRSGDPAALSALEDSLREARAAIGRLRPALSGTDPGVGRALDQLDAAGRRLETLLRSGTGELSARIVELPVLEPLFVLDDATLALRDALHAADEPRIRQMFALTLAAACLLAATALLLAFWVRRSLLVPLRRLVADLAAGSSADLDRLALRPDEIGTIATALRGGTSLGVGTSLRSGTSPGAIPATVPAAAATLLPGQDDLLRRIHTLLESLAGRRTEPLASPSRNAAPASPPAAVPAAAATDIPIFAAQPSTTPGTPAPGRDALATLLDASATAPAHTAASQDLLRQPPGGPGRSALPELTPPAGPDPATRSERPHPPPEPAPATGQSTSATTTLPHHAPACRPGQDKPAPSLHHLPGTNPTHPAQEPDTVGLLRVPAADLPAGRMSDHRAPEAAGHPRADLSATPDPRATTRPHPAGEDPPPRATGTNQPGNRNPQASSDNVSKHAPSAHGSRPAPGESLSASPSPAPSRPGTTEAPNEPEPPRAPTHTLTGAPSPHQPAMPPGEPEQGGTRPDSPAPTTSQPANAIFTNEPEDRSLDRPASPGDPARHGLAHRPNDPGHPRVRPDIRSASPSSSGITPLSHQPDAPARQPSANPASPSKPALSTNEPGQGDTRPDSPSLASPRPAGTILPNEPEDDGLHQPASPDGFGLQGPLGRTNEPGQGGSRPDGLLPASSRPEITSSTNEPELDSLHQPASPDGFGLQGPLGRTNEPGQGGSRPDGLLPASSRPEITSSTNEPELDSLHQPASPDGFGSQGPLGRTNEPGQGGSRPGGLLPASSRPAIASSTNEPEVGSLHQPAFPHGLGAQGPLDRTNEPRQGRSQLDRPLPASSRPAGAIFTNEPEDGRLHQPAFPDGLGAQGSLDRTNEPWQGRSQLDRPLPASSRPAGAIFTNEPEDGRLHQPAFPDGFDPQGPGRTFEPGQGRSQLDGSLRASSRPAIASSTNEPEDDGLHQPASPDGFGPQASQGRTSEPEQRGNRPDGLLSAASRPAIVSFTNEPEDDSLHQPAFSGGFGLQGPLVRTIEPGQGRSQLDGPLPVSSRPAIARFRNEPEDDGLHQPTSSRTESTVHTNEPEDGGLSRPAFPDGFGAQDPMGHTNESGQGGNRPDSLRSASSRPESTIRTSEPEDDSLHRPAFPSAFDQRDAMARTSEPKQDKNRSDSRSPASAGSGSTVRTNEPEDDSLRKPSSPAAFNQRDAMDHTSEPGRGGSRPDSGSPVSPGPASAAVTNEPEDVDLRQPSSPAAFSQCDAMDDTSEPVRSGNRPESRSPVSPGPASAAVTNEPEDGGLRQPSSPATFRQRDPMGRTSAAGQDGNRPDSGSPASAGPGNTVRSNEPENGGLRQPAFPATFSQRGPVGRTSEPGQGGSRPPVLPRPASTVCTNEPEDDSLHQPASLDGFGAQGPMDRVNGSEEGRNRPDSLTPASPGTPGQHGPMARTGEAAQDRTRPEGPSPAPSRPASAIRANEPGNDRPRGQASAGAIGLYSPAARTTEPGPGSSRPEKLSLTPPGAAGADRADQPAPLHRPAAPGVSDALGPSGRMIDPGQGEAARKTRSLLVAETRRTAPASAPEADNPLHAPEAPARHTLPLRTDQPGPSEPGRRTRSLLSADPRRPDLPNEPETGSQPPAAGANAQHSPATRPDDAGEPGTGPAALGRRPRTASPPDPHGPVRRAHGAALDGAGQTTLTIGSSGAADAEPISPPGTASPALRSSASLSDPQDPVRRAQGADLDKTSQAALTLRSSGAADAELTSHPGTAILPRQPFTALPDPHDQARHAEEARRPGTEPDVPSARPLNPDHADLMGTPTSGASTRMASAGQTDMGQQAGGTGKAGNGRSSRQDAMPAADPPKQAGRTDGPGKSGHVDAAATIQPHGPALLAAANRSDEAAGDLSLADADRAGLADPSTLSRHSGAARLTAGGSPPAVVAAPGPLAAAPPPASLGAPDVPRQDQASQPAGAPDRPTMPGRADPAGQKPALPSSISHKSRQPSPSAPDDHAPAPDAALPQASRAERAGRKERRTGPDQAAALPTDADRRPAGNGLSGPPPVGAEPRETAATPPRPSHALSADGAPADRRSPPGAASQPRQSPAANRDPAAASEPGARRPAPAPASAVPSGSPPNPAPVPDPAPGPDPVGRAHPDPGLLLAAAPAPATGSVPGPAPALPTAIGPDPAATAPPAAADPAAPSRSSVLHSIVQMVAQEQVRRHHHGQPAATDDPAEQRSRDDQLVAALVDRVLARLDQVTRQVKAEDLQARRAS